MFKVKRWVTVYEDTDLTVREAESRRDYLQISWNPPLWLRANLRRRELYDVYLAVYDFALPQDWVNEWMAKHGSDRAPEAVWCYEEHGMTSSLLGYPVFWDDILARFRKDAELVLAKIGPSEPSGSCATCGKTFYFREDD